MTDEQFNKLAELYGFAPSRSLRELVEAVERMERVAERERIAAEWDGCMYGDLEDVNIGAAIRARGQQ